MLATWKGYSSIVDFLAFRCAVINKSTDNGCVLNSFFLSIILLKFETSFTSAHIAASNDHTNLIESLFLFGIDLEAIDKDGRTALMNAVRSNRIKSVRLLLDLNADTLKPDRFGWTVAQTNNNEMKQLLLEHLKKSV